MELPTSAGTLQANPLPYWVAGYMAYPEDAEARAAFVAACSLHERAKVEGFSELLPSVSEFGSFLERGSQALFRRAGGFRAADKAKPYDDELRHWRQRTIPAQDAGSILLHIVRGARAPGERGSIREATHLIICQAEQFRFKSEDGSPLASSRSTVTRHWRDFQSISHLWAAYLLRDFIRDLSPTPSSEFTIGHLLAGAKELQFRTDQIRPARDIDFWLIPEGLELPSVALEIPPLSEELRVHLATYQRSH